jgi:RHS repeat-associated protein
VYDAENRVVSATNGSASGSYTYDGNSLRVEKVSGSTTTVYIFSGSKVIAEYDNNAAPTSPSREYIYSGGALLAKIASGTSTYYHQDQLSNRLVTDSNGNTVEQLGTYPFGESWYNTSSEKWLFTTYERDAESLNDYALARSYVNRLGRFSSPDLLPGWTSDPQSLDHYSYTLNDPINLSDPAGLSGHNPQYFPGLDTTAFNIWLFELFVEASDPNGDLEVNPTTIDENGDPVTVEGNPGLILGQPYWNNPTPDPTVGGIFGKALGKAFRLILKAKCATFLQSVMQGALLLENGLSLNSSPNSLAPYAQILYNGAQGTVPAQLASTAYAVNMTNTNVESNGYVTNAQVFGNQIAGGSTLYLYQGFANQAITGQAQILLHEGTHLFAGASDNQLAAAAGVPNASNLSQPQASAAYQQKLQGKCK